MKYNDWINFNKDITELKDGANAWNLIEHAKDNTEREKDKHLLNPNAELKNVELKKVDIEKIKNDFNKVKELKRGGKGAKPYRFGVTSLNVEPTKQNEHIIKDWADQMLKLFSKYYNIEGAVLHLNETRPHIHFIFKNWKNKQWGNFVEGKKLQLSGEQGKKILNQLQKEGEAINEAIAKKYNLKFNQAPTTEKGENRKIHQFTKQEEPTAEDINGVYNILKAKGVIKENNNDIKNILNNKGVVEQIIKHWGRGKGTNWKSYKTIADNYDKLLNQNNELTKQLEKTGENKEQTELLAEAHKNEINRLNEIIFQLNQKIEELKQNKPKPIQRGGLTR